MEQGSTQNSQPNPFSFLSHTNTSICHNFIIPQYQQLKLNPFPNTDPNNTRILKQPQFLPQQQILPTYSTQFIKQFQYIAGAQNLFPILLQITHDTIYVCSKDCFIGFKIKQPSNYEKVKLPQMPTCFKVCSYSQNQLLYFGLKSGAIIVYNINSKTTVTMIQQFGYPIVQIQDVGKDTFIAMDLLGNVKVVSISVKMFMERVVKVSVHAVDVIEQFRVKKRDKLKNFVKSLPFRKDKQKQKQKQKQKLEDNQNKNNADQSQNQANKQNKHKNQQTELQLPKFRLLPSHLHQQQNNNYSLIYYYKKQLKSLILDQKFTKISQTIILDTPQIPSSIGMLQLGQGGFSQSNQSHIILVLSIQNKIHYYRQIYVQNIPQYIKITQKEHSVKIFNGKFLSNNLLVYLTENGIEIGNVNSKIQFVSKINYQKFGYIDFFNQEEGFNFDKRLLYGNIMKIGVDGNGDCVWCVLQGKRIQMGRLYNWKNYLSLMSQQHKWQKCMKTALMIYKDKITLLANIPQRIQQRNQAMKSIFQKITLTYLSYQLKNSDNPLQHPQIVKNAIDFMVRTESFVYLFTTIYEAVVSYGLEEEFIQKLEEYVESGAVRWMSDNVILKVVEHYKHSNISQVINKSTSLMNQQQQNTSTKLPTKSQKQIQTQKLQSQTRKHLQTMIINFDLSKIQKSFLLAICLNNQLYRSLIHICKQQADYVTPIIKLCGLIFVKFDQLHKIQENNVKSCKIQHIVQNLNYLTQIIFYYVQECLLGHYTQHNNTKCYVEMLQQLISFIFIPSSLMMLVQASISYSFRIFNMMFGARVMQFLLENQGAVVIKNSKYINSNVNVNVGDKDQDGKQGGNSVVIIQNQVNVCILHYFNSLGRNQKNGKDIVYLPIFQSTLSTQLTVYNNMLCILLYTAIDNYKKYHPSQLINNIIPKLPQQLLHSTQSKIRNRNHTRTKSQLSSNTQQKQKLIQNNEKVINFSNKLLSQKQQSQILLYQCHKFVTYLILSNSFPIRLGWRVLAFQFIIVYPKSFSYAEQFQQVRELDVNAMLMRIIDSILRQINRICAMKQGQQEDVLVQKMLNLLLNPLQLSQKDSQQTQILLPTKCYILNLLNNTNQLIKTLLKSKRQTTRNQIFSFLFSKLHLTQSTTKASTPTTTTTTTSTASQIYQQLLQNPQNQQNNTFTLKSPIISTILQNIKNLLKLSPTKTLTLITKIYLELVNISTIEIFDILATADYLVQYPQIQLEFLYAIIKVYEEILHLSVGKEMVTNLGAIGKNMDILALRHLKVVMLHKKQQLQQYMLKINYPLEDAYRVCQQSNNKTAMAYVLIKSGRNLQGVQLICQLFVQNSRQVFRDLAKNIQTQTTISQMKKMNQQLAKILQTCSNQYINDIAKGQQMWQKISQKLFKQLNLKAVDSIPIVKIRQLLQQYIDNIINTMFSQVNPQFFVAKFSQNNKMAVPTRIYLKAHDLVYQRLGFRWEINSITKSLLQTDQMKNYKTIVKSRSCGIALEVQDTKCDHCEKLLFRKLENLQGEASLVDSQSSQSQVQSISSIIMYNCGHNYHISCYKILSHQKNKPALKQNQPNKSPKSPKKGHKSHPICPKCQSDWNPLFYGQISGQPQKFSVGTRQRQSSIFVQRKNKLVEYDCLEKIQNSSLDFLFMKENLFQGPPSKHIFK